ncbi:uncharacterized protein LOC134235261 [Saccostrea cucullata]|uniref:uncharacterized protein LOC134235261 n=1 Tax=Saccostrea cuccullata TaxID=36930 RepID=UPI002ED4810F
MKFFFIVGIIDSSAVGVVKIYFKMSVPAIVSILAALLSVSLVMEGIDAQTCQAVTDCSTEYGSASSAAGQDKTKLCNAISAYITCLEAAGKKCGIDIASTLDPAKTTLSQAGCQTSTSTGGYATPFLGFVTMVLGVLIFRSV